jgi:hypothetical protein
LIATLTLTSILATSAIAKTEKTRATHVDTANTVACGHVVLADPDSRIRADFQRNCDQYAHPGPN